MKGWTVKYQRADGKWAFYPHKLFQKDLDRLERFLTDADAVVPLREIAENGERVGTVAMRHDVDHNLDHAIRFAEWEAERGYRATYFVLHTAWYYDDKPALQAGIERLVELGHEVGLHSNATMLAAAEFPPRERWNIPAVRLSDLVTARIAEILDAELLLLRETGVEIVGTAAHGDIGCYEMGVYNDLRMTGMPLERFGLTYDADQLARAGVKLTDNHGSLHGSLATLHEEKQTFMLIHPCHWQLPARDRQVA